MFKFIGGPYDGTEIDHATANKVGESRSYPTKRGAGSAFFMPSPNDYARILNGEIEKNQSAEPTHPYWRIGADENWVYFQYLQNDLAPTLAAANLPLSDDELALREKFARRADELVSRLKADEYQSGARVWLVYICRDPLGNPARVEHEITPRDQTTIEGDPEASRIATERVQREGLLANVDSAVRHAALGFLVGLRGKADPPLQIRDFDIRVERTE